MANALNVQGISERLIRKKRQTHVHNVSIVLWLANAFDTVVPLNKGQTVLSTYHFFTTEIRNDEPMLL